MTVMKPGIGLFAKPPIPGSVKTRLTPPLSPEQSSALYAAFLEDLGNTLSREDSWDWVLYSTDPQGQKSTWPKGGATPKAWRAQRGVDLGERIESALGELLAEGRSAAVLLGSDHPTVSRETLVQGITALDRADIVLGPTLDGGYYLVGTRQPPPRGLFSGIAWSTPAVLDQTLDRVRDAGLTPALLPPWYDVDTVQDLRFLEAHLKGLGLANPNLEICPSTRKVLANIEIK